MVERRSKNSDVVFKIHRITLLAKECLERFDEQFKFLDEDVLEAIDREDYEDLGRRDSFNGILNILHGVYSEYDYHAKQLLHAVQLTKDFK